MSLGASVEGGNFKPGPMGAKGLGQLAYDKGMRILASTRADDIAWEHKETRQGLMSFALVKNGLEDGEADHLPIDGTIGLSEWLKYAVARVPSLYTEVKRHKGSADGPKLISFDAVEAAQGRFKLAEKPPRCPFKSLPCLTIASEMIQF